MTTQVASRKAREEGLVGFATLDARGRVVLSKAARKALGLHAGSSLAYMVVDGTIVLIPQDEHLAGLFDHAAHVLERAGLSPDDLLAELPIVREEIMRERYGDEFVDDLQREHAAIHAGKADGGT